MTAQNPDVIGTWYIINVINDFQPIPYTQPPIITEVASIKFLDTTDAVNVIGFSGCNNFQVEADVSADTMFGYGDIFLSNFSSEMKIYQKIAKIRFFGQNIEKSTIFEIWIDFFA